MLRCRDVRMFSYFLFREITNKIISFFYSSVQKKDNTRFLNYYDGGKEYTMIMSEVVPYKTTSVISAEVVTENGGSFDVTERLKKLLGINCTFENQKITLNDVLNICDIRIPDNVSCSIIIIDNHLNESRFHRFDVLY